MTVPAATVSLALALAAQAATVPNIGQPQAASVKVALQYTGGKQGTANPKASPVEIGWVNIDSGPSYLAAPGETAVVKAAFAFANQYLDGVGGHPLELVQPKNCSFDFSHTVPSQQGVACANDLLKSPNVHVILFGSVAPTEQQLLSVLGSNKKAVVIGGSINSEVGAVAPSAFFFGAGDLRIVDYMRAWKVYLHAKTVTQVWPDNPGSLQGANAYVTMFKKYGLASGKPVVMPVAPTSGKDVVPGLRAAKLAGSAVAFFPGTGAQCIGFAEAMKTLGLTATPVLIPSGSPCLTPQMKAALGDYPHWTFESSYPNVGVADPTGQLGTMFYALKKYAGSGWLTDGQADYTPQYFGLVMGLVKWLDQVGPKKISKQSVSDELKSYTGPVFLGPPSVKFGVKPLPSVGTIATRLYQYLGNGHWKYVTPWVSGPLSYAKYFGL